VSGRAVAERSSSLAEDIALSLEEEIISGRLRPRERLVEMEVAAHYGVSRAPVREALRILEQDDLVSKSIQGFEVADMSAEEAADVFEILAHLEELYTRRAAPHIDPSRIAQMRRILADMAKTVRGNNIAAYFKLNLAFHATIRKACPNRALINLLESLGKRTLRFRRLAMSIPGRLSESLQEHRRILTAIERGDAEKAGQLARDSAEKAYARLTTLLSAD
jgi:DNA-binding GntR family transcriptional regulator